MKEKTQNNKEEQFQEENQSADKNEAVTPQNPKTQENIETFSGMLTKLNPIRVEAVMSKFPLHKITPNEPDEITIVDPKDKEVRWRVINRPGIAAYKFHTLILNREIERTGRPVPALLPVATCNYNSAKPQTSRF